MNTLVKRIYNKIRGYSNLLTHHHGVEDFDIANKRLNEYWPDVQTSCYVKQAKKVGGGIGDRIYRLSIIIPAYNVDSYVVPSVDSVLQQETKYPFEVIIIDDGSTDNTPLLLKKYNDIENVRLIRQDNKGASGARNTGLDVACGEYIMFVDADDKLLPGAIEALMDYAVLHNADIVAGGYIKENWRKNEGREYNNQKVNPLRTYYGFSVGKVYRCELFANVRFPDKYWFEDSIFAQIVWPLASNCYTIKNIVYSYNWNPNGATANIIGNKKSVDSLYITRSLLKDKMHYNLKISSEDLRYFLGMVKLTYSRTKALPRDIQWYIFSIQCELYETYFKNIPGSEEFSEILTAIQERRYHHYLLAVL